MDPLMTILVLPIVTGYLASLVRDMTSGAFLESLKTLNSSYKSKGVDIWAEFEKLGRELTSMRTFLREVEKDSQTGESELLANWVNQVRDAARDVEDMIELISYCALGEAWGRSLSSRSFDYVIHQLPRIKDEFESGIPRRRATYSYQNVSSPRKQEQSSAGGAHQRWRQLHVADEAVGMVEEEIAVVEWLTSESPGNAAISICGMGGVGKTSLARRVYASQRVQSHFDCSAWVSISTSTETEQVVRSIIRQLCVPMEDVPGNLDQRNREALLGLLGERLHRRRCIIILDGVLRTNAYSVFACVLQNGKDGSRILVTTRDRHVASSLSPEARILDLKPLPEAEAWALFCKQAFWMNPGAACPGDLEEWARKLVDECEGLPLGIAALGSVLSSKDQNALTWNHFHSCFRSELADHEMLVLMSNILMQDLDDLPSHVRKCYLYCCSVFPEKHHLRRGWLVRLLEAEGLVEEGMAVEEVAECYLKELVLRNMLQAAKMDESDRIVAYRVHSLMREICLAALREEFCTVLDEKRRVVKVEKPRRLSIQTRKAHIAAGDDHLLLRSLLFFVPGERDLAAPLLEMTPKFMLLKVLELRGLQIHHVPDAVVDLFNLRYLSLRGTAVEFLPKHINRLQLLETLDVRESWVRYIPRRIKELKKLRHLLMDHGAVKTKDELLIALSGVHSWVRQLQALQTLKTIDADDERIITDLACLSQLRRLGLKNVGADHSARLLESLSEMRHLLSLSVAAAPEEALQLDSPAAPPPSIRKLVLEGRMRRAPRWLELLGGLTHLYLLGSQLEASCRPITLLEKLENLAHLTLEGAYDGEQLCFRAKTLLRLRSLKVAKLRFLRRLRAEEGALPSLCALHLWSCMNLQGGGFEGIDELPCLRHVYLQDMPASLGASLEGDVRVSRGWQFIIKSMTWL